MRPLQTLTNVVGALREEDYSFRARGAVANDALGELALEINALADILTEQRIQTIEATALLRRVVDEIDAPLFTFDPDHILRLVNAAGERLLQQPSARLLGKTCRGTRTQRLLRGQKRDPGRAPLLDSECTLDGAPKFLSPERRASHTDRALRREPRPARRRTQRMAALDPRSGSRAQQLAGAHHFDRGQPGVASAAASIAGSSRTPDFQRGLNIIESRTASLHRFLQSYRRLAQMPSPTLQPVELRPLLERVAVLETRLNVEIVPGPDRVLMIDPDLIEQMLINLVRNAVDAALEQAQSAHAGSEPAAPRVSMRWEQYDRKIALIVEDNGIGLLNPSNAFVPFYTTKPGGSGIGLVLSQQIAEAHGGSIELANRRDTRGCIVKVLLPYRPSRVIV